MGIIAEKLGRRIKELREYKKLTQFEFAELLNMESTNVSKIERGLQIPKEESLIKIANILNVSVGDLFDYEHFTDKEELINNINEILNNSDLKTLQNFYKILKNIKYINL